MPDRLQDVWFTRDLPVLIDVTGRIDLGENFPSSLEVAETTGLTHDEVRLAANALERRGLVDLHKTMGGPVRFGNVAGAAYLITGLHPDPGDQVSTLVDALRQAAEQQTDPEERTKLKRAADVFGSMTQSVAAGVLTAVIRAHTGM